MYRRFLISWIWFLVVSLAGVRGQAEPLIAPPEYALYEFSNIRREKVDDKFRADFNVLIDFKQIRDGKKDFRLAGRSGNNVWEFHLYASSEEFQSKSGTLRLEDRSFELGSASFWLEKQVSCNFGGSNCFQISNRISMDKTKDNTFRGREWTERDKAKWEECKIETTPPTKLPEGFVGVDEKTRLVPGLPIMYAIRGKWVVSEVVVCSEEKEIYIYDPIPQNQPIVANGRKMVPKNPKHLTRLFRDPKWLAVDRILLQKAESNPSVFRPSVRVRPGENVIVPDDFVDVTANTPLAVGIPVKRASNLLWKDATIESLLPEQRVQILQTKMFGEKEIVECARSELIMHKDALIVNSKPIVVKHSDDSKKTEASVGSRDSKSSAVV